MSKEALRQYDKALLEMSNKALAKLPPEDQVATGEMCLNESGDDLKCTKQKDHPSEGHVAHGLFGIVARWL